MCLFVWMSEHLRACAFACTNIITACKILISTKPQSVIPYIMAETVESFCMTQQSEKKFCSVLDDHLVSVREAEVKERGEGHKVMRWVGLLGLCGLAAGSVFNIEDAGAKDGDDRFVSCLCILVWIWCLCQTCIRRKVLIAFAFLGARAQRNDSLPRWRMCSACSLPKVFVV